MTKTEKKQVATGILIAISVIIGIPLNKYILPLINKSEYKMYYPFALYTGFVLIMFTFVSYITKLEKGEKQ